MFKGTLVNVAVDDCEIIDGLNENEADDDECEVFDGSKDHIIGQNIVFDQELPQRSDEEYDKAQSQCHGNEQEVKSKAQNYLHEYQIIKSLKIIKYIHNDKRFHQKRGLNLETPHLNIPQSYNNKYFFSQIHFNVYMIKNNQKRYEYNTNPINSHQKEHYKHKYTNNVLVHDYPFSSTTPINKANNHHGSQDQHHKINSSMTSVHENHKQNHKHQEKYEPRKRINSASNVKRHEEKVMPHSKAKNFVFQQNYKNNNKKIYFGDDSYNDQFDTLYNKHTKQNKHAPRDERRLNNEEAESNVLQENVNHQNNSKKERNKEYVQYRNELKGYQASVQINQKEIFDKIGRINRINEEINNRLAKMLNKIDNV